jgi:hypothetical protein
LVGHTNGRGNEEREARAAPRAEVQKREQHGGRSARGKDGKR